MALPGFFEGAEMPASGWWEALWPEPARVLSQVGIEHGMTVIDLCAGDGWFTLPIAKLARMVYAIDIDARLLEKSRVRLREAGFANCRFVEGDAYDIAGLVSEPADFAFLANALHSVPDKSRLAKAVHAGLKPCGLFAVVNWYAKSREETLVLGEPRGPATELRMTHSDTAKAIEPAGFTMVDYMKVSPYHYAALFQR